MDAVEDLSVRGCRRAQPAPARRARHTFAPHFVSSDYVQTIINYDFIKLSSSLLIAITYHKVLYLFANHLTSAGASLALQRFRMFSFIYHSLIFFLQQILWFLHSKALFMRLTSSMRRLQIDPTPRTRVGRPRTRSRGPAS